MTDRPYVSLGEALDALDPARIRRMQEISRERLRRQEAEQAAREADPEYRAARERAHRQAIDARLVEAGWPRGWAEGFTLDGVPEAMRSEVVDWATARPLRGAFMIGATGLGKTGAALVACRLMLEADPRITIRFAPYCDLLDVLAAATNSERDREAAADLRRVRHLVIDDLGVGGPLPDRLLRPFYGLIDARQREGLATTCTTNLPNMRTMRAVFGAPCVDRLIDPAIVRRMRWRGTVSRRTGAAEESD